MNGPLRPATDDGPDSSPSASMRTDDLPMTHRAFCEDLLSDTVVLTDSEAHHVLNVLRIAQGTELNLFDGKGHEAHAQVTFVTRRDVTCNLISRRFVERSARPLVTVAASPPKGDRLRWMVEKLTEIGVDQLILLQTDRTILVPGETRLDKLRTSVIGACKQSRRSYLLDVSPLVPLKQLLTERALHTDRTSLLMAHPGDSSGSLSAVLHTVPHGNNLTVLIGPEGGFTDEETSMATGSGIIPTAWPETILRIETAAIVFAAALLSRAAVSGT